MSSTSDDRLARLLSLLPWLRAHPGIPVASAAAQFGITEEQLRADISLLWFCGLPGLAGGDLIDVEFEGDTVRVLDAQTLDRPLRLTGDEGVALLAAARSLRELPGLVDVAALDRVIDKLSGAVLSLGGQQDGSVAVGLGDQPPRGAAVLSVVRAALTGGLRLRLRYLVEQRDEMTDRVVDPVELRLIQGRAYLNAWDPQRHGVRFFRLDRIEAAELLDEAATPPEQALAGLNEPMLGPFTTQPGDVAVVLELARAARWVADYYPVESVVDSAAFPGGQRVTLRTPDPAWVTRLVIRLGGSARVVSPPELSAEVTATAAAGLHAYAAHPGASLDAPSGSGSG